MGPNGTLFGYNLGPKGLFNVANLFTVMRLPATIISIFIFENGYEAFGLTLLFFAALTDFLDGQVARRTGCASDFGEIFDPSVDKVGAFIVCIWSFWHVGENWFFVAMVLSFELIIAGLSLLAVYKGAQIKVEMSGKWGIALRATAVFLFIVWSTTDGASAETIWWLGALSLAAGIGLGSRTFRSYLGQYRRAVALNT